MLDVDLALVYGVTTKRLNQQLRRNRKRFPEDFAFRLTAEEFEILWSQIATLSERIETGKRPQIATASLLASDIRSQIVTGSGDPMWSQIATTSQKRRRKTHRPWAFTEHGALQAANVLRSDRAIAMSVYVIRAFIKQREKLAANAAILKRLAEIDKTLLEHDSALRDIYKKLLPLVAPPPEPTRRQIGFGLT